MKTFEEALRVSVRVTNDPVQAMVDRAELKETVARFAELIEEVRTNPILYSRVHTWADRIIAAIVANRPNEVLNVILSVFCCGLGTGIEMEKVDPASFARTQGAATDEPEPRKAPTENNTGEIV